ncbi:hypothetical protein V5O48_013947 [Marasmius crinis-equi]|uniref:Uncharacterized protein n=1 Tax=Marasmius crinis-equi TaxID=585013 RepID=A0ABR3EZ38_9AGAR
MSSPHTPKVCLVSVTSEHLDIEISPTGEQCRYEGSRPLMTLTLDAAQLADAFLIRLAFPNARFKPSDENHAELPCSPTQLSEYSTTEPDPIPQFPSHLFRSPATQSVTEPDSSPLFKGWESRGCRRPRSPIQAEDSITESDVSPVTTSRRTLDNTSTRPITATPVRFLSPGDRDKQTMLSQSALEHQAHLTPEKQARVRNIIPMKRSAVDPEYADHVEESQEDEIEV